MRKSSKTTKTKKENIPNKINKTTTKKKLINETSNLTDFLLKNNSSTNIRKHIPFKKLTTEQKLVIYEKRTRFNFSCSLSMMLLAIISFVLFLVFSILIWNKAPTISDKTQIPSCFMCLMVLPLITFVIDTVCNIDSIIDYIGYLKLKPEQPKDKKMLCAVIFTLIGIFLSSVALTGSISLMCWTMR